MSLFAVKSLLSFFVGMAWISYSTILAEKFGSKLGGAIAGVPATMVVALFFIGLTQNAPAAVASTFIVPLVVGINALFVVAYIYLSKKLSNNGSLTISLAAWFIAMTVVYHFKTEDFNLILLLALSIIFISYVILEKILKIKSAPAKKITYTAKQTIFRGVVSGLTVAFAVVMSKLFGPKWGGIFASFPALTVAMIIIIGRGQTKEFLHSLLKNFIITGTLNVIIFVLAVRYLFIATGIYWGTLFSFLVSIGFFFISYHLINKKLT